ncbi:MAG TPA: hypothetical protein DCQ97_06600 [Chitinophagaceae bacterium]|nr:hypothetical protein [Chitinophagaceae bacterium]
MKQLIPSVLLLLASMGAHAQQTPVNYFFVKNEAARFYSSGNPVVNEELMRKSRNQRTAGWCFVGAGAVGLVVGLASFPKDGDILFPSAEEETKADRATTITVIGSALMLGSIPFFVLSNVNKRKARISVSSQSTGLGIPPGVSKYVTGVSLIIPVGK